MRALVVGASGLVGGAILRALGDEATGTYLTRPRAGLLRLDARDRRAFADLIRSSRAEVVYLPAAQPNVEWCETHPDEARSLNIEPVIAALTVAEGRPIIGFSTDYVFDGAVGPYAEDDVPAPLNAYGRIKLELEETLAAGVRNLVVRTTGVFGLEDPPAKNFVLRLLESLRQGRPVRVPADQISTPTYAPDLAHGAITIAESGAGGIWHVSGPDLMARTELATMAASAFHLPPELVIPVPTSELGQVAPRPLRAGLRCERYEAAFGRPGRPTREALAELRRELGALAEADRYGAT